MAKAAECPVCDYETLVFEDDIVRNRGVTLLIPRCPECDPEAVGDPTVDETRRLTLVDEETHGCPKCGEPVTSATVSGPSEATARPCGCSVHPEEVSHV